MPVPKKRIGGRPPKYTSPDAMEAKIADYFDSLRIDGDKPDKPPTMAGLALALGFADRQSLRDYGKDEAYSCVIKKARMRIENYWESKLAGTSPTGAIFWLKNHAGYADRQDFEMSGAIPIMLDKALEREIKRE